MALRQFPASTLDPLGLWYQSRSAEDQVFYRRILRNDAFANLNAVSSFRRGVRNERHNPVSFPLREDYIARARENLRVAHREDRRSRLMGLRLP